MTLLALQLIRNRRTPPFFCGRSGPFERTGVEVIASGELLPDQIVHRPDIASDDLVSVRPGPELAG